MLNKLLSLYPNAILFSSCPTDTLEQLHVFFDSSSGEWIGIPKADISAKEVKILKTIFEHYDKHVSDSAPMTLAKIWYNFLFLTGQPPSVEKNTYIRIIQFHIKGSTYDRSEVESAMKGFFPEEVLIVWESEANGVLIESQKHKNQTLSEKDLAAMVKTLESDFYVSISLYYGKQYSFSDKLPGLFHEEQEYFTFGQNINGQDRIYSFERIFPLYMAHHLPGFIKEKMDRTLVGVFKEDPEMFSTIKVFLENNLNASLTAKKLYIHRNTLQYRIDKFTEKTGIQLKEFSGAFTVYLGCLLLQEN